MNFLAWRNFSPSPPRRFWRIDGAAKFAWLCKSLIKWVVLFSKKTAKLHEALPVKFVLTAPAY